MSEEGATQNRSLNAIGHNVLGLHILYDDFRHIIVAENRARKVTTNCGDKGKCVNGQCVHDS